MKMVLVAAVNDWTHVRHAYESYALRRAARYEVGAGVYKLCATYFVLYTSRFTSVYRYHNIDKA